VLGQKPYSLANYIGETFPARPKFKQNKIKIISESSNSSRYKNSRFFDRLHSDRIINHHIGGEGG